MKKIIIGMVIAGFLLVAGLCGLFYRELNRREAGEHVANVRYLPKSASDITYVKIMFCEEYEFAISESEFVQFAKKKGRILQEIQEPKSVRPILIWPEKRNKEIQSLADYESTEVKADKGLFHQEQRNNGGGYTFLYNRDTGRAYYWYAHH
ncbi:hypothetical protein M2103_001196 [Ereboglobus sp. PH5-5]|uniref:hypothetical protein n=1 Tax=unclassified Ereboglobus TaxID=2626932 RepID=UPI00240651BD|nr:MULTISPECIES: hypothetical protein [unclassified Ereboglobus]MDF9826399.1 hypothetical protein [Ereboglobus sp. PH5-10]MDF9832979.1 hypothetical protein [Ereboglobus sp. PH5-5]